MTGAIPNLQAMAGGSPLQAAKHKERARKASQAKANPRAADDSFEISDVEQVDAVREAEQATSEEAREDQLQHPIGYNARGGPRQASKHSIDLKG